MEITLKIRVKQSLADRLEPLLTERGLTLDQTVGLYLRGHGPEGKWEYDL